MSQSGQKLGRSMGKRVWTDDKVELLLKVTVSKTSENVDNLGIIPDEELQYSGSFCSTGYAGSNTVMSSFSKMSVFTVHMKTQKCHFQKFQVWRALFKGCVFSHCLRRICVGGRPICKEKLHFQTKTCGRASSPSTVILA